MAKIETDLAVLKWLAGTNLALTLGIGWLVLRLIGVLG
jgi:hypothetical protein